MLAVIGLRMQLELAGTLLVLGPPGTRDFIDGLLAASAPEMRAGYGIPGQEWSADIEVTELTDGDSLSIDGFAATVAENTHLSMPAGDALIELARGADLLVSEMIDVDAVLAFMRPPGAATATPASDQQPTGFARHMYDHHMTPLQVGELASAAGVARLVIKHYAPNPLSREQAQSYLDAIAKNFVGKAELAVDLGRYRRKTCGVARPDGLSAADQRRRAPQNDAPPAA